MNSPDRINKLKNALRSSLLIGSNSNTKSILKKNDTIEEDDSKEDNSI
jgi:hypothetical protein